MVGYWIVDYRQDAKKAFHPVIIGGRAFTSESQAQSYIDNSNLSGKAEIIQLDTTNQGSATQKIKGILIKRYKSLDKGMGTVYHDHKKEQTG